MAISDSMGTRDAVGNNPEGANSMHGHQPGAVGREQNAPEDPPVHESRCDGRAHHTCRAHYAAQVTAEKTGMAQRETRSTRERRKEMKAKKNL